MGASSSKQVMKSSSNSVPWAAQSRCKMGWPTGGVLPSAASSSSFLPMHDGLLCAQSRKECTAEVMRSRLRRSWDGGDCVTMMTGRRRGEDGEGNSLHPPTPEADLSRLHRAPNLLSPTYKSRKVLPSDRRQIERSESSVVTVLRGLTVIGSLSSLPNWPEVAPTYADVVAAPELVPQAPFTNLRCAASLCRIQSGFHPGR